MNFEEAMVEGARRNLNPAGREADLKKLCGDPTFPSLLGLIVEMKEQAVGYTCDEAVLSNPGLTARAGGQLAALTEMENRLREHFHAGPSGLAPEPPEGPSGLAQTPAAKPKRKGKLER